MPEGKVIYIRNVALVLSASVTLLTGFDTFFNHRALRVRYTQTVTQLLTLKAKLDYITAVESQEVPEDEVDSLFEEMQRTLSDTNRWWQDQRAKGLDGRKKPPSLPTQTIDPVNG